MSNDEFEQRVRDRLSADDFALRQQNRRYGIGVLLICSGVVLLTVSTIFALAFGAR